MKLLVLFRTLSYLYLHYLLKYSKRLSPNELLLGFSIHFVTPFFVLDAPTATRAVRNKTVSSGTSVSFHCPVDGNPDPAVTWYKGSDINGALLDSGKVLTTNESGCYTCYANNSLGSVTVKNCLVFSKLCSPV